MDVVFDNISSLIIFTILFLFLYAALLNIYFIHKNGFYVTANCWFCNKNSKVLYKKRNNFECTHCTQYNGFQKNGDYNKVIEAQHNTSLNTFNTTYYKNNGQINPKQSSGLCESCNKNQQLRVLQLARYEPLQEANYEKEIEHFESQLEKTYKLCKTCSKVLKGTIRKQNAWIFGNKLKNLKSPIKKGLFAFGANKKSQDASEGRTFYFNFSVVRFILLLVSVYNLVVLCGFDGFIPKQFLPKISLPYNVMISDIYSYIYNVGLSRMTKLGFPRHLPKTINVIESNILHISLSGFFIELFFSMIEKNCSIFGKLSKLLSWVLLGIISAVKFKSDISIYTDTLQIFCSCWLIYSYSSSFLNIQSSRPKKIALKRIRKSYETKEYSDDEESSSESLNETATSYTTAYNKRSPITAGSLNNSLNKSFESIKSMKTAPLLNSTYTHNGYSARNVELNKHFNELNLGVFEASRPMSCQSYRSPASPNPFLSQNNRPQSPSSLYNYDTVYKNPSSSFSVHVPQPSLFKLQNPNVTLNRVGNSSLMENRVENQPNINFNQTQNISPRSDRLERMSVQSQPYSIANNFNDTGFCGSDQQSTSFVFQNKNSNLISPKDTASVYSHNGTMLQRSPTYSLRSQSGQNATFIQTNQPQFNNTFRPLSPASTIDRPSRSLLSPGKLGNIKSFHSDSKEHENLSLSFHAEKVPAANFWSNLNNSHINQRFVVNSVPDLQCNSPFVGSYMSGNGDKNIRGNSRSSSSSSGFISNSEFNKVQTQSLPNSRDHSPDRNSLLSEPAYHFKID